MNEITIVTGFFDIGRKDCGQYSRSNEKYLEYFKFWSRIKNNLIVYTYKEMAEEVKKVREEFGLLDKTTVIVIDDITEIEPEVYNKMLDIENNKNMESYRFFKNLMENKAQYDYVMLLKCWCLADAAKKFVNTDLVAWIDFGFGHGGDCYINPEEFSFLWRTNLEKNKIHLFYLGEVTEKPIFELVKNTNVCLMGAPVILDKNLCETLWDLVKESNNSLLRVGFIDDDQLLLLMAYREKREIFELHKSNWFMPLKENGAEHLTIKSQTPMKTSTKIIEYLRNKKRKYIYLKGENKNFNKCI